MKVYLGIDVGAITTKFAVLDECNELLSSLYLLTEGRPVEVVQQGMKQIRQQLPGGASIGGVATTGSARYLAGVVVGADLVKNEITCQAVGARHYFPEVQTIIEIGGQDSKLIILRDGMVIDFGLNTVCAAGTGSFLDHQAQRLKISQEEFARRALASDRPVRIAGRCTVFAESAMIHKQQTGHKTEDIIYGLCRALVRNYLSDVGAGKDIRTPVVFQGGVAFNRGIVRAFQEELGIEIMVPPHHEVMGAIGAALLVSEEMVGSGIGSKFRGFNLSGERYHLSSLVCNICPDSCEVEQLSVKGKVLARWGGRCDFWERSLQSRIVARGSR